MLDNTITLPVDPANNEQVANEVYTRYEESANRSSYIGQDHSLAVRNTLAVTRSFPTVSGNFKGVAKSALKFTQDIEVEGVNAMTVNSSPMIGTVGFSFPVGTTPSQAMHLRQRIVAAVDHEIMIRLTERLEV